MDEFPNGTNMIVAVLAYTGASLSAHGASAEPPEGAMHTDMANQDSDVTNQDSDMPNQDS